jgi:membrane-associated phospholipid phosphatase
MTATHTTAFRPHPQRYRQRQLRAAAPFIAWGIYLALFSLHVSLRAIGDEIFPWHSVGGWDRALTGQSPPLWLQERLYGDQLGLVDRVATGAHIIWFACPFLVGAAITVWRRDLLVRFLCWLTATWFTYDTFSLAFPARPPWMADGEVVRVLFTRGWVQYVAADTNPVAAFPSLHVGIPAVIGLFLLVHWPRARWLGYANLAYALLVGFSVIYLGEHWLVDVLAGLGVAWVIRLAFVSKRFHRGLDRILPGKPAQRLAAFECAATATMTGKSGAEAAAASGAREEQKRAA